MNDSWLAGQKNVTFEWQHMKNFHRKKLFKMLSDITSRLIEMAVVFTTSGLVIFLSRILSPWNLQFQSKARNAGECFSLRGQSWNTWGEKAHLTDYNRTYRISLIFLLFFCVFSKYISNNKVRQCAFAHNVAAPLIQNLGLIVYKIRKRQNTFKKSYILVKWMIYE